MEAIAINDTLPRLAGSRLLVSVQSLGLVGQLAGDLLLGACEFERVAHLSSEYHVPVVGAVDGARSAIVGVTTPVELYYSTLHRLALVHQRSPPLKSQKDAFVSALVAWIKKQQFASVLLLGSMDAATRRDDNLSSGMLRHLTFTTRDLPLSTALRKLCPAHRSASKSETDGVPLIPAGGVMRRLVAALSGDTDGGALLAYVVEGDNREDATVLARAALEVLGVKGEVGKQPRSWSVGLYGQDQPQELFG